MSYRRLATHFDHHLEPPNQAGDEVLVFAATGRRVRLEGSGLGDFARLVLPLLDGRHALDEIHRAAAGQFAAAEIDAVLAELDRHRLLLGPDHEVRPGREPLDNYLHEHEAGGDLQTAQVAVVGVSALGLEAAAALAGLGVGEIVLIDDQPLTAADLALSTLARALGGAPGVPRAHWAAQRLTTLHTATRWRVCDEPLAAAGWRDAIAGCDLAVSCLDPGLTAAVYRLNRLAHEIDLATTHVRLEGSQVVLGPTVQPHETSCALCATMRSLACAADPEAELADLERLQAAPRDKSDRREALPTSVAFAAQLVAMEALTCLLGTRRPSAWGAIVSFDTRSLASERHVVLRHPGCAVCGSRRAA